MKPGSIILNWRQKGNLWNGTVLNSLDGKFRKVSFSTTVFWGCDQVLLVDAVLREETVNSDTYIRTMTDLRKCFI